MTVDILQVVITPCAMLKGMGNLPFGYQAPTPCMEHHIFAPLLQVGGRMILFLLSRVGANGQTLATPFCGHNVATYNTSIPPMGVALKGASLHVTRAAASLILRSDGVAHPCHDSSGRHIFVFRGVRAITAMIYSESLELRSLCATKTLRSMATVSAEFHEPKKTSTSEKSISTLFPRMFGKATA